MITETQYKILTEIRRYNDDVKRDIPFHEVTSICRDNGWIQGYILANEALNELINEKYLMANKKHKMSTLEDYLTITNKGRSAIRKYERQDKYKLVKKLACDIGVNVTSKVIIVVLSALCTIVIPMCFKLLF